MRTRWSQDSHRSMPRHRLERTVVVGLLAATAAVLVGAGVWLDTWWTIAGGVIAGAAAAWIGTEPA